MEDSSQLLKWMVSGPEVARIVNEFEQSLPFNKTKNDKTEKKHHEQTKSMQQRFAKHVLNLLAAFEQAGNPFLEDAQDLIALDTRNIANRNAIKNLKEAENIGENQFKLFVADRIKSNEKSIFDIITKNKILIFNQPKQRSIVKKDEMTTLKKSCHLFSQLYIACQVRDGDLDEFFKHENTSFPPSLSKNGDLRSGSKSDLIGCLSEVVTAPNNNDVHVDCIILDGAAIVNMLKPNGSLTFQEYADKQFCKFIAQQLARTTRVDIVWDVYINNSLKLSARSKRGNKIISYIFKCMPYNVLICQINRVLIFQLFLTAYSETYHQARQFVNVGALFSLLT